MSFIEEYRTLYPTGGPNEQILLSSRQPYQIDLGGRGLRHGVCDISLKLLPKPRIEMKDSNPALKAEECLSLDHLNIYLKTFDTTVMVLPTLISTSNKCIYTPINGITVINKPLPIAELCFSLINFRPINYPFVLEWAEWIITFTPTSNLKHDTNEIRSSGGFMITHFGSARHKDESDFNASEFIITWNALYHFLSFANGLWSTPILPVGFDSKGEIVFQQIQQPFISSMWSDSVRNWFDDNKPQMLERTFHGFMSLLADESWSKELKTAVYWYVNSEGSLPSLDTTLILAQAALELLSWHYLVIVSGKVTEEEFKSRKFPASNKIRQLLIENSIPIQIPTECDELTHLYPTGDGPFAITDNRNDIVHPVPKKQHSIDEMNQVWDLSMYYIEKVILNLSGFKGEIDQRFRPSNLRGDRNSL